MENIETYNLYVLKNRTHFNEFENVRFEIKKKKNS